MKTNDCDCDLCNGRMSRLLAWLDSQPGPWLQGYVWGLLTAVAIVLITLAFHGANP